MKFHLLLLILMIGFFVGLSTPHLSYAQVLTTVFYDDFTDEDGTSLTDHNSNWGKRDTGEAIILNNTLFTGSNERALYHLKNFVQTNQCVSADFLFPVVNGAGFSIMISPENFLYKYYDYISVENTIELDYANPWGSSRIGDQIPINLPSGWHNHKLCFIDGQLTVYLDNTVMSTSPVSVLESYGITSGYVDIQIGENNYMDNFLLETTSSNAAPIVESVTVTPNPVQINTEVIATVNFSDSDSTDAHTATADWGISGHTNDSCTVNEPNGSTPGYVSCTLPSGYSTANVYTVAITVSDGTTSVTSSTFASVYDVNSSFIGGSIFDNPLGANPSTTGKVKFGITSKYVNGVLSGHAKMNFKNANIDFASTSLSSLVTLNGRAYLTGSGTVNNSGNYTFLAVGIDEDTSGAHGLIRFKIVDSSNTVIYDSQPSATNDYIDPTTPVNNGGGIQAQ